VFYHLYPKATIAFHAMEEISAQAIPKTTQVTKRTMVDAPVKQPKIRCLNVTKMNHINQETSCNDATK